jgi:hypothetical protein
MESMGTPNLTSLSSLLKLRDKMRMFEVLEVRARHFSCFFQIVIFSFPYQMTTPRGFKFHAIDMQQIVAADLSNPTTAALVHADHSPNPNFIEQDWDGSKWHLERPISHVTHGPHTYFHKFVLVLC